ncbi:hypothetical protein D3C81_1639970 [compost metagenome]
MGQRPIPFLGADQCEDSYEQKSHQESCVCIRILENRGQPQAVRVGHDRIQIFTAANRVREPANQSTGEFPSAQPVQQAKTHDKIGNGQNGILNDNI